MPEFVCPQANNCAYVNPGALECGMDTAHTPPLPPANELCLRALQGRFDMLQTADVRPGVKAYSLACVQIDLAMARPAGDAAVGGMLDTAQQYLGQALAEPGTTPNHILNATVMDVHLPAFEAVQAGESLSSSEYADIQHDLAVLAGTIEAIDYNAGNKHGHRARLMVPMLAARLRLPYLPSTLRQCVATQPELKPYNHEGTFFIDGMRVPVRILSSSRRERGTIAPEVLPLRIARMAANTYPLSTDEDLGLRSLTYGMIDILRREGLGESRGEVAAAWAGALSSELSHTVHDFAADKQEPSEV